MKTTAANWMPTTAELETAETHDLPDWILALNARAARQA